MFHSNPYQPSSLKAMMEGFEHRSKWSTRNYAFLLHPFWGMFSSLSLGRLSKRMQILYAFYILLNLPHCLGMC